jgi:hypothetical protein
MKNSFVLFSLIVLTATSASDSSSEEFDQTWSGASKMQYIWDKIEQNSGSNADWVFPLKQGLMLFEDMSSMFEQTDFAQKTWYSFGLAPRVKTIHAKGVVQKIRWESMGTHDFTGLFKGGENGLIRYSLPVPGGSDGTMLPGIALKFFRNGVFSGNIHAMDGLDPTTTANFFEYQFSNHMKEKQTWDMKLAASKFAQANDHPISVGLSNFGKYDESGIL